MDVLECNVTSSSKSKQLKVSNKLNHPYLDATRLKKQLAQKCFNIFGISGRLNRHAKRIMRHIPHVRHNAL